MRKSIRGRFWGTLTVGLHVRTIYQISVMHNILGSLVGVLGFFVVFHFFCIDIYAKDNNKTALAILTATLVEILLLNSSASSIMIGGLIILNLASIYLSQSLKDTANKRIVFKSSDYFRSGGYIFTMAIATAYSLFCIGLYEKFPFSCKDLNEQSGKLVTMVTKPMNIDLLQNQDASTILANTKVTDLLNIGKILNIESDIKGITPIETFKTRKNDRITKTIADHQELNQGICEFSLNKLNEKLKHPGFQASVVLLMVAITYPFLRIAIQIVSLIGLFIFILMKKIGVYSIQKIPSEVEKIG